MISVTMQRDDDVLLAIAEQASTAPGKIKRFVGSQARGETAQSMIRELAKEPPKPRYPLRWQSSRQRRYVMATLRKQNNIPYRRTGKRLRGWRVLLGPDNSVIVENNERGIVFLQGDYQQKMHIDTGWPAAAPIIVAYESVFQDQLIDYWYSITAQADK